jgi:hypothetical protein
MQVNGTSGMDANMHSNCNMKDMHGAKEIKPIEIEKTKLNQTTSSQIKVNKQNEVSGKILDLRA